VLLNFVILVSLVRDDNQDNTRAPRCNFINPMVFGGSVTSYGGLY